VSNSSRCAFSVGHSMTGRKASVWKGAYFRFNCVFQRMRGQQTQSQHAIFFECVVQNFEQIFHPFWRDHVFNILAQSCDQSRTCYLNQLKLMRRKLRKMLHKRCSLAATHNGKKRWDRRMHKIHTRDNSSQHSTQAVAKKDKNAVR